MAYGKFITLEGSEGAGKSTALHFIHTYLTHAAYDVIVTREPGGTARAEKIRELLLHPTDREAMPVATELLLMFASCAEHIAHCIKPALQAGKVVISDRYIDASYAYQGGGRHIAYEVIHQLDAFVVGDCYPDLTLLFDIPVEIGQARTLARHHGPDRIEQEQAAFFMRVRQAYLARAQQDPNRIKVIDASLPLPNVQQAIIHCLMEFFAKR